MFNEELFDRLLGLIARGRADEAGDVAWGEAGERELAQVAEEVHVSLRGVVARAWHRHSHHQAVVVQTLLEGATDITMLPPPDESDAKRQAAAVTALGVVFDPPQDAPLPEGWWVCAGCGDEHPAEHTECHCGDDIPF